jgi:hypothetical protein
MCWLIDQPDADCDARGHAECFDRLCCQEQRDAIAAYERDRERSGPVTIALG